MHVSTASTVVVNLGAFAMSVVALTDLAGSHGVPDYQAWLLPIVLEGLVLAATAGTVSLSSKSAAYAWVLMILSMLTSATGNVVHAYLGAGSVTNLDSVVAMVIAAIPPLWLLLSTHLTVLLVNDSKRTARGEPHTELLAFEAAAAATAVVPEVEQGTVRPSLVNRDLPIVAADNVAPEVIEAVLATA
ncbi:DUF2637 domain-containing protein [Nocardia fluminea]|uniref:DUF2637 domain-containing protein n=1 Tax=Nocardia fluminea TaxID=134984 RepID=UPI0036659B3B